MIKREPYQKGVIYLETKNPTGTITFFRKTSGRFLCYINRKKDQPKKMIYSEHAIQRDFDLIAKISQRERIEGDQAKQKENNEIEMLYFTRLENQMIKEKIVSI